MPMSASHLSRAAGDDRAHHCDEELLVALPEPNLSLSQDAEWFLVRVDGEWRQLRFHDYDKIYEIPGLYEKVIYDICQCESPATIRGLLETELRSSKRPAASLRNLDLGAGNGMVAEELVRIGCKFHVGVDIIEEAAAAAERDRPGLYASYHVLDLAAASPAELAELRGYRFNCMTCVAALGFGDIPTAAFRAAYNLVEDGGLIAFNIKEEFLSDRDGSGFSALIGDAIDRGAMDITQRQRYRHRLGTDGKPLYYVGMCAVKRRKLH